MNLKLTHAGVVMMQLLTHHHHFLHTFPFHQVFAGTTTGALGLAALLPEN